ncbi:efflux RND transporter periplasmic adaptor subunit [Rhodopseudomonas sp. BR0G17]|uniref:efflux RND transporter periplasmic adaptor subunit n=1 Tax=Rhodopseudomonas sp. BR0G17 TaxID=2269368 RepID=UPI0013E00A81|nr:efflux RND transporter periplasmic adaptor subunit [Rhodopseudomonas sp. BR0G17]NEW98871.1 efflux RND transporter periplasmic adaptor subunit [Rhodopseudomonas sp. BR0G17]
MRSGSLVAPAGAQPADTSRDGIDLAQQTIALSAKQVEAISIEAVEQREFRITKDALGSIAYNENLLVQVFTPYAGRIIDTFFNLGDEVKKGAPLFTIDSSDLLQAESTLLATAGVLELQNRNLNRVRQLLKTGGAPQRDVDQATSDQQTAEGNHKAARDAVRIFGKSEAEIDRIIAERHVDSTLIVRSPVDGQVTARNAAPGLYVQPGSAPAPLTLANLSIKWMVANVVETDAPAFRLGQPVEARVAAYPGQVFRGRVTALGSSIDPSSHRQLVRSEIDDPANLLRPGMLANFTIEVAKPVTSPAVRLDAVVREGDGTMAVWVTRDRRSFQRRLVKIGLAQGGRRQILDGLAPGELVVGTGAIFLSNKLANAASG